MSDGVKKAYLDKAAAQIREWSAQVDLMKAQLAKGSASARLDIHSQIKKWQKKETLMKSKIEELRSASADRYESIKDGVQNVWEELSTLIDKLEGKKPEKKTLNIKDPSHSQPNIRRHSQ